MGKSGGKVRRAFFSAHIVPPRLCAVWQHMSRKHLATPGTMDIRSMLASVMRSMHAPAGDTPHTTSKPPSAPLVSEEDLRARVTQELTLSSEQDDQRARRDAAWVAEALDSCATSDVEFSKREELLGAIPLAASPAGDAHAEPGLKSAGHNVDYLYASTFAAFEVQPDGFSWKALAELAASVLLLWPSTAHALKLLCIIKTFPEAPCKVTAAPFFPEFMGAMFGAVCRTGAALELECHVAWSMQRQFWLLQAASVLVPPAGRAAFLRASLLDEEELVRVVQRGGHHAALAKFLGVHKEADMRHMIGVVVGVLRCVVLNPATEKEFNQMCGGVAPGITREFKREKGPARRVLAWCTRWTGDAAAPAVPRTIKE